MVGSRAGKQAQRLADRGGAGVTVDRAIADQRSRSLLEPQGTHRTAGAARLPAGGTDGVLGIPHRPAVFLPGTGLARYLAQSAMDAGCRLLAACAKRRLRRQPLDPMGQPRADGLHPEEFRALGCRTGAGSRLPAGAGAGRGAGADRAPLAADLAALHHRLAGISSGLLRHRVHQDDALHRGRLSLHGTAGRRTAL